MIKPEHTNPKSTGKLSTLRIDITLKDGNIAIEKDVKNLSPIQILGLIELLRHETVTDYIKSCKHSNPTIRDEKDDLL